MKQSGIIFFLLAGYICTAQERIVQMIDTVVTRDASEAHLSFLASDEMRGRDTGSPELEIAANYIRTHFRLHKIKAAPGTDDYFQQVDLVKRQAPISGSVRIGDDQYVLKENLLVLDGAGSEWHGEFVYVGYGSQDELEKHNINGKMVLALAGSKDANDINKVYLASLDKFANVKKRGAKGLVEVLVFPQVPWPALVDYLSKDKWTLHDAGGSVPFVWVRPKNFSDLSFRDQKKINGSLSITGNDPVLIPGKNVAAIIEGTDPQLRDEHIVITAHYDHVGVDPSITGDSIFNGARDNATGTVALLQAARFLSDHPPRRSVVLLAVTAEEKGLLGSKWYASHPLVPLEQTVLNLNSDGVGYNDTNRVTSISLGRTNTDVVLQKAASAFGFTLGGDPDPREGFYERSDQVSFAKMGVPGIKLQPGLSEMNNEIFKYYHRAADEVGSLDFAYLTRFFKTFVYAAHLLANEDLKPAWVKGDKFEPAAKKLYGR